MGPSSSKRASTRPRKAPARDQYSLDGNVSGHAVVVQGPDANVTVEREASPQEIEQQYREQELLELKQCIAQKYAALREQAAGVPRVIGNPYPFGRALSLQDRDLLCGRDGVVEELLQRLEAKPATILAGSGGVGKTSLLQAGLAPALLKRGHLPIVVPVQHEPLDAWIKRQFLEEVENTRYLGLLPLSAFLKHVTQCLPEGKHLVLLLDRFEEAFADGAETRQEFKQEWALSLLNEPSVRWLFCVHLGYVQQMSFLQPELNPLTERVVLPSLDREAARSSIQGTASFAHVQVDSLIAEDILDRLGVSSIHPAQLQTVCYLLTGGSGPIVRQWDMTEYERRGYADGILREALDQILSTFPAHDRESAWQVLACLVESRQEDVTTDSLANRLKSYGIQVSDVPALLEKLAVNHLVDIQQDDRLRLADSSLQPRILQWASRQAASRKIRQETARQVERIRNSAMRGLIGGAIAFALFDLLIYTGEVPDATYLISFALPMAAIGGIAGILLTLTIDLAISAYQGPRRWMQYLVGALGGALAFCVGFLLYANNNYVGQSLLEVLPAAAFEGLIWGGAIGLAVTWVKNVSRGVWLSALGASLLCGLVLLAVESWGSALSNELWPVLPSWWRILLAGILPAFLFQLAALSGHPPRKEGMA